MLHVNLSMGESTRFGAVLNHFWYSSTADDFRGLIFGMSGYPHNGGQHTLIISDHKKNIIPWLELFKEKYPVVSSEINFLLASLSIKDNGRIVLADVLNSAEKSLLWRWVQGKNQFIDPDAGKIHEESEWTRGIEIDTLKIPPTEEDYIICREEDAPAIAEHIKKYGWSCRR